MVKGILIDTDDETSSSPMAIPSGFFSGLASATIFRNDDALLVVSAANDVGRIRDQNDRFGVGGWSFFSTVEDSFCLGCEGVVRNLRVEIAEERCHCHWAA